MKNWKVNILTVKLFSVAANDLVFSSEDNQFSTGQSINGWPNFTHLKQLHIQQIEIYRQSKQTYFTKLHGDNPVDLQRQRHRNSNREYHQKETEMPVMRPAYPCHHSDDEVMEDGPQHHRAAVGVVAQELP